MATSTQLPEAVQQEIEDLPVHYRVQHRTIRERVMLTASVRGVPVVVTLDSASYPFTVPELELASGWSWESANGGRIDCLESQARWNRTLGLAVLLRELGQQFRDLPPVKTPRRQRLRLLGTVFDWIRRLLQRLLGRNRKAELPPSADAVADATEPLPEVYDRMIREHTERVHRYQRAVEELVRQWRRKAGRLETQRAEKQDLEERQAEALEEAESIVDELEAKGRSADAIRSHAGYRRVRATYEECSADLSEVEERVEKLEADAEKHLGKLERHEAQLEKLMDELEDLKDEAAEVVTDMTLVRLEKEIVDLRAGISQGEAAEELREVRRRLRKERAVVRVTRETTAVDDGDELYLEVAERVSAARELEETLGLEKPPPRLREPEG